MPEHHLSGLEDRAWGGLLHTHSALWAELERRLVKNDGLTFSAYDTLLKLNQAGRKGIRMSDLAREVLMSNGGVSRLADRLERDGLLVRTRSEDDLRGYVARITPAGRKVLARARRRHLQDVRRLFYDRLEPEDLEALARIWDRLGSDAA